MSLNNKRPKVKLCTLWMLDYEYERGRNNERIVSENMISDGIWKAHGVEEKRINKTILRLYTMVCVNSYHPELKVGKEIIMDEVSLIEFCHRVKIVHLPKFKSIIK